jgi:hypothetical protein
MRALTTAEMRCRVAVSLLAAKRPISIRVRRMVTPAREMMTAPAALLEECC